MATSRLLGGLLPRQLMGGVGSCRGGYSMFFGIEMINSSVTFPLTFSLLYLLFSSFSSFSSILFSYSSLSSYLLFLLFLLLLFLLLRVPQVSSGVCGVEGRGWQHRAGGRLEENQHSPPLLRQGWRCLQTHEEESATAGTM